jgi:N-acetylglucosaminyldiphosphoundecaprenol N-acetyl-beta-D-mannosaminyltransferase
MRPMKSSAARWAVSDRRASLQAIPRNFKVLGVKVAAVQIPDVVCQMERWIGDGVKGKYIACANVHMIMEAVHRKDFAEVLAQADLVAPDGMPLIWTANRQGLRLKRRVYGPDLLMDFCRSTQEQNYRHYFFGGAEGVAETMVRKLQAQFPLNAVGIMSPPFRKLTPAEDRAMIDKINDARPDIVWVCLGCPKQERWMYEHRDAIQAPVMVGLGQAFDIYAGTLKQAPPFMREHGLEWLFRLFTEPRRLWRRYLVYNSKFIYYNLLQSLGLRSF